MDALKRILNSFRGRSRVAACTVLMREDATLSVDVCIVIKKGTSLVVTQKAFSLSLEKAKSIIGDTPVIISLAGESIIHKKIDKTKEQHWGTIVPQVIPKLKSHDFFIQYTPLDELSGYISLIRKQVVEAVAEQFVAKGFALYDLILGPFALQSLVRLIAESTSTIKTPHYEIQISSQMISQLKLASEASVSMISIGQSVVESDILIQYASCITFFTNANVGIEYSDANPTTESRRKFEEAVRLRLAVLIGSSLLILFLIGSALALGITTQRLAALQQSFGVQVRKSQPGENVVAEFAMIRNTVDELGLTSHHYLSFYAERIAITKPHDIFLTELKIFPVIGPAKQNEMTKFNTTIITISGGCNSNEELARWIEQLSSEKWIAAIKNQIYHRSEQRKPASFSFEIHILHR